MLIEKLYWGPVMNNSHRGDFVEMMVLDTLGPDWEHKGLGWNPWDLQRGSGTDRARIQVRQCAALQLWGKTKRMTFHFSWNERAPRYFRRDNPNEAIESQGRFCELFVVGVHDIEDEDVCDQTNPLQWKFMIVPSCDLKQGQNSMALSKAIKRWPPIRLSELKPAVESKLNELRNTG